MSWGQVVILALWCSVSGTHLGLPKLQCSCLRNGENSQGPTMWTQGALSALEHGSSTEITIAAPLTSLGHPPISTSPPGLCRAALVSVVLWGVSGPVGSGPDCVPRKSGYKHSAQLPHLAQGPRLSLSFPMFMSTAPPHPSQPNPFPPPRLR